jgi:hypothetical protein
MELAPERSAAPIATCGRSYRNRHSPSQAP